jgi:hypothetical protein
MKRLLLIALTFIAMTSMTMARDHDDPHHPPAHHKAPVHHKSVFHHHHSMHHKPAHPVHHADRH